jgi:hypothetical protein
MSQNLVQNKILQYTPVGNPFHKAHSVLYKYLTESTLNELLWRADPKFRGGILQRHIRSKLAEHNIDVFINTNININSRDNVSIFINFWKNRVKYAHISLHISGDNFKDKKEGMWHVKNNISGHYTDISFNKLNEDNEQHPIAIELRYNPSNLINVDSHPEYQITLDVLNRYFSSDTTDRWHIRKNVSHRIYEKNRYFLEAFPKLCLKNCKPRRTEKTRRHMESQPPEYNTLAQMFPNHVNRTPKVNNTRRRR